MCTCSEIYKECNKIFLRNNFRLEHKAIVALRTNTDFAKKLQVIEIDWEGKWADSAILHDITAYPNLRVLNLRFWIGTIKWGRRATRNYQFQDNQDIKWFSKLRGFDFLVSLRGLEKVTFEIYGDMKSEKKEIQDKVPVAQKAMEDLLNRELTKPKLPTLPVSFIPQFSCTNFLVNILTGPRTPNELRRTRAKETQMTRIPIKSTSPDLPSLAAASPFEGTARKGRATNGWLAMIWTS